MSKSVHTILSFEDRKHLCSILMNPQRVPSGTRIHFTGGKRTSSQNTRMWGTLTSVSEQVKWHGMELSPTDWKDLFTAGLTSARIVPNLEGNGFVALGLHTSDLSKEAADNLQEMIYEFGAGHGVVFKEPRDPPGLAPTGPRRLEAPTIDHDPNEAPPERAVGRSQGRIRALFAAVGEDLDERPEF